MIVDRVLDRASRVDPRVLDWTIALGLTATALLSLVMPDGSDLPKSLVTPGGDPPGTMDVVGAGLRVALIVLMNLPLAFRRKHPTRVMAVVGISTIAYALTGPFGGYGVGVLFALYSLAVYAPPAESQAGLLWTLIGVGISFVGLLIYSPGVSLAVWLSQLLASWAVFGVAWVLGDLVRTRSAAVAELRERQAELEASREENERLAITAERARIARELHDAVAHNVSVMVVQAGAARRGLETGDDPEATRVETAVGVLSAVEATGRATLTEMRRMVGALRPAGEADYEPAPSLDGLPALVERVRAAGLEVDLVVEGEERAVSQGVGLSAYRIVQEALTNTLRHAHAHRARVVLRYTPQSIEITVTDDGRGAAAAVLEPAHRGYGLMGMRERTALLGGTIATGPRSGGGFEVAAVLPTGASA